MWIEDPQMLQQYETIFFLNLELLQSEKNVVPSVRPTLVALSLYCKTRVEHV
jgi:hypothetical protein